MPTARACAPIEEVEKLRGAPIVHGADALGQETLLLSFGPGGDMLQRHLVFAAPSFAPWPVLPRYSHAYGWTRGITSNPLCLVTTFGSSQLEEATSIKRQHYLLL